MGAECSASGVNPPSEVESPRVPEYIGVVLDYSLDPIQGSFPLLILPSDVVLTGAVIWTEEGGFENLLGSQFENGVTFSPYASLKAGIIVVDLSIE